MPSRLYNNLTVLNRVPKYNKVGIAYHGPVYPRKFTAVGGSSPPVPPNRSYT